MAKYLCTRVELRHEIYRYEDEAEVEIPDELVQELGLKGALAKIDQDTTIHWESISDDRVDTTDITTEYEEPIPLDEEQTNG